MISIKKGDLEFLRTQAKEKFDRVKSTWSDLGRWAQPHRIKWLVSQNEGERNNHHIVDPTHILALRSYVAGFLEGNTSATRPWYRIGTGDQEKNLKPDNHAWLDKLVARSLNYLQLSNFYDAAGQFYYDHGTFNTGAYFIDERGGGRLHWHVLIPGSYYVLNNSYGEACVLVLERSMSVKAIIDRYGKKVNGVWDWSNFSSRIQKMYEDGNYSQCVDIVTVVRENSDYDPKMAQGGLNKKWISITYELGSEKGPAYSTAVTESYGSGNPDPKDKDKYLEISTSKRKPFIIGKGPSNGNFEYGEKGPTLDALGLIKSLNKKAISKDQAVEQMLRPAMQGPANLKKSYISTASNTYVPLDASSLAQKGLRTVYEINPAITALVGDVQDLRQQVDRLYYADYLLYLSRNPKTRTATETDAVVQEQQLIIGPNLQSLNWTHNVPVVEYIIDYVLDEDPFMPPPPEDLGGEFLRPEFISVFAQAQKAADLPSIERYMAMIANVGQLQPQMWDKANLDRLADLYEDRLYLPAGLNRDQSKTEALREQAMMQAQRQQEIEQLTQVAGAAKDVGLQINNKGETQ